VTKKNANGFATCVPGAADDSSFDFRHCFFHSLGLTPNPSPEERGTDSVSEYYFPLLLTY
jgi:hypothetical protein